MFGLLSKNKEGIFNVGLLEMAIALYPIIAGYGYGSFKLAFGFLLIIDVCLIGRYEAIKRVVQTIIPILSICCIAQYSVAVFATVGT